MARSGTAHPRARRWAKTDDTQRHILDAATDAFGTRGFTAATMADVVAGSGASIGSIYHHFGGKGELFLAIFEQMANAVDRRIEAAWRRHPKRYLIDGTPDFLTKAAKVLEICFFAVASSRPLAGLLL